MSHVEYAARYRVKHTGTNTSEDEVLRLQAWAGLF